MVTSSKVTLAHSGAQKLGVLQEEGGMVSCDASSSANHFITFEPNYGEMRSLITK